MQGELLKFSDWAIVGTTILSVPIVWPLTAVANTLDLDLVAIFKLFVIPVNSGWVPLSLAITWPAASSTGIIAGEENVGNLNLEVRRDLWPLGRTPQLDDHMLRHRRSRPQIFDRLEANFRIFSGGGNRQRSAGCRKHCRNSGFDNLNI